MTLDTSLALADLSEPRGFERDDVSAEGLSGNYVDVVEVDDAIGWDADIGDCEFEFADEPSDGARDRRHGCAHLRHPSSEDRAPWGLSAIGRWPITTSFAE